ncbi:MAG: DUF3109 family protein [Bernardetiaceae bacterium]|nr:DUF3109 family protein [Bernardetiaceae bacterium]
MFVIKNTLISEDIRLHMFVCDIKKCKGACCEEGEMGAPLEEHELPLLKKNFEAIKKYIPAKGLKAIEEQGLFVKDKDGDWGTPLVEDRECAYAFKDEQDIWQCGMEKAYHAGESDFRKPISCHLYPLRLQDYGKRTTVNYDKWDICDAACVLGESTGIPLYVFLKEALIRRFGENWYAELCAQIQNREKEEIDQNKPYPTR